jgi:nucleoside-diphosphate-sugar epimerase
MRTALAGNRPYLIELQRMSSDVTNQPGTCLITGSRGYLGSCIRAAFLREAWRVVELTRNPPAEAVRAGQAIGFTLGGDISPKQFDAADALVHCAYDFTLRSRSEIMAVNVAGAEKLMRAAREAGVRKQVFISSMSAFEGCRSLYGNAKLELEAKALASGALVLRPGLIYGERPRGIFGNLVASVAKSKTVPLLGDGSQVQYLSHEADLCKVVCDYAAGRIGPFGGPVAAANDRGWPFREILQELAKAQGSRARFVRVPWRLAWLGLRCCELCHVQLKFRSDSLIGLVYSDPNPPFEPARRAGLRFREFDAGTLEF